MLRCLHLGVLIALLASTNGAAAQQYERVGAQTTPPSPEPTLPVGPDLAGPGFEVLGGSVIMLASVPVAILVLFFKGPSGFLPCHFEFKSTDAPSDPCEERERRDEALSEQARRAAILSGLAVGLVGSALVIHGAIRIRRAKTAFRLGKLTPVAWSVQPLPTRAMATATWNF